MKVGQVELLKYINEGNRAAPPPRCVREAIEGAGAFMMPE
jgi:hypothetical protein